MGDHDELGPVAAVQLAQQADGASLRNLARIIVMVALALVALYAPWRIGAQITGGLDPNATVNAWGGPTYVGALLAHSLDAILGFYAVSFLLGKLLAPARPRIPGTGKTSATAGRGLS